MSTLALLGGKPVLENSLKLYRSVGEKEKAEVLSVLDAGCLSGFFGSWQDEFWGGPKIQAFERSWAEKFNCKHTISVNSNTTGLLAALGAAGISPGDEVIVPATTMSATAIAPLFYGGIPVFADLEDKTFCLDVDSVRKNLTEKTKAIIAVNLFGHPAELRELRALCDQKEIILIEDNAQAVLATEHGRLCGTIGHIGVFSLNYHKHIHTGEGGICITDNDDLALRMQMIRNHAEAVVQDAGVDNLVNMVGLNFRMTELSAAIGLAQLSDIDLHIARRKKIGETFSTHFSEFPGIKIPSVRDDCTHAFYVWTARFNEILTEIDRDVFAKALQAEGFECYTAYVKPLYRLPAFKKKMAIGRDGFPFTLSNREYPDGLCPVAERLHEKEILSFECCAWDIDDKTLSKLVDAFTKVYENRNDLRKITIDDIRN